MFRIPELVRRSALYVPVGATASRLAAVTREFSAAFGARPSGARLDRMLRSPRYRDGAFHNPPDLVSDRTTGGTGPGIEDRQGLLRELLFGKQPRRPAGSIPVVSPDVDELIGRRAGVPRMTWFGHATVLVELDGHRVLFDPVWSERVSPSTLVGPRRMHPMPLRLAELPPVDAVVISHDHYDHLDMATIRWITTHWPQVRFCVPLGVGAHLEHWSVPAERIVELDWAEHTTVGELELTATAARHFSGRRRPSENGTLWASWVVAGPRHRVFYTGDSGYFAGYREIGAEYGPFDVTMVQIGAYSPYWPDIHMTPEEGIAAHLGVRGELLVPVHWGTFNLALHAWSEPIERVLAEAELHGVRVAVPRPGQPVSADTGGPLDDWWRAIA